ncbi:MAG: RNB domain-containing ribonuclease [Acidimicrobiia bacterium]|nr:RNB domain-containing ribonuclease [Acidimicrobiia bacterium]
MRLPRDADPFAFGLARIREEFDVPGEFPAEVVAAAEQAAARRPGADHVDRTAVEFVTLDPASARDLDQAFAIERAGDDVVLHYAIADVGFFVRSGDTLDREAWARGVTVYLPGDKAALYPPVLSEGAASLLPDAPKPAVVFTVLVDEEGDVRLDGVERAVVRSRAKLAYDTARDDELPPEFAELARRIQRAEQRRDAPRVDFPEQEIEHSDDGAWRLMFRPRLPSEERNAGMSLATNLAVADTLHAAETGLYRVMAEPDERAIRRLRHTARAFGFTWPQEHNLLQFQRTLPAGDARSAAFLIAVRRAGGGASYERYIEGQKPWHAAMAATYAHATAPLRRLADRYVVEAALAVANGRPVPNDVQVAFVELPATMERAESVANRVDSAVLDLAEAVLLAGREGDVFDAVVVDEDVTHDGAALVQLSDPAVLARVSAHDVDPGDDVRVKVVAADIDARRVELQRVG